MEAEAAYKQGREDEATLASIRNGLCTPQCATNQGWGLPLAMGAMAAVTGFSVGSALADTHGNLVDILAGSNAVYRPTVPISRVAYYGNYTQVVVGRDATLYAPLVPKKPKPVVLNRRKICHTSKTR